MMELADSIEARAAALTARVVDEMYANPFWDERFGERGRRRSVEDGRYHLTYLADALALGESGLFANYVRWTAASLERRGFPRQQVVDTMVALEEALLELPASAHPAVYQVLAVGRAALAGEESMPAQRKDASG